MPTSYQKFYEAIKEPETRKTYEIYLNRFLEYSKTNHDEIMDLGQSDIEDLIFNYIIHLKDLTERTGKPSPNSYNVMLSPVKLFLDMNDVLLNWIKLKKLYPPKKPTANQLPYSDEDVKDLLNATTNVRNKAFIHFLSSSGCRVGAISTLNVGDVEPIENGAIVTLYKDTLEEYRSCLTPEAFRSLMKYLQQRLNRNPLTPLFTTKNNINRLNHDSARDVIRHIRKQAKLQVDNGRKSTKGKSQNHAFRKRFEICLANADVQSKFIEYMMGHYEKQDRYYFRGVSNEDIWRQFKKAIPNLILDKTEQIILSHEAEIDELSNNFKTEYKEKIESLEKQMKQFKKETAEKTISWYHSLYGDDLKKEFRVLDMKEVEECNSAMRLLGRTEEVELGPSEKMLLIKREQTCLTNLMEFLKTIGNKEYDEMLQEQWDELESMKNAKKIRGKNEVP